MSRISTAIQPIQAPIHFFSFESIAPLMEMILEKSVYSHNGRTATSRPKKSDHAGLTLPSSLVGTWRVHGDVASRTIRSNIHGFRIVLRDALALGVHQAEIELSLGVSLIRGKAEPLRGFHVVLRNAFALKVRHAAIELDIRIGRISRPIVLNIGFPGLQWRGYDRCRVRRADDEDQYHDPAHPGADPFLFPRIHRFPQHGNDSGEISLLPQRLNGGLPDRKKS
jgi:hypothetical protein